jgi:predicted metal-binding membrane protein
MSERAARRAFFGISALLFAASAAATMHCCASMSTMAGMPMPGGWTMSMAWMRMPGQTWAGAAASFLGMWVVMMAAMMLPSLAPVLWSYRRTLDSAGERRAGRLSAVVGIGYFFAWGVFGIAAFALGAALAAVEMRVPSLARAAPVLAGVVVAIAGAFQFSPWKAHHLACCREVPCQELPAARGRAWQYGVRLGMHCGYCCAGFTLILLVMGVMDLRTMALLTAATTLERLAPAAERVRRALGIAAVAAGSLLIVAATGALAGYTLTLP